MFSYPKLASIMLVLVLLQPSVTLLAFKPVKPSVNSIYDRVCNGTSVFMLSYGDNTEETLSAAEKLQADVIYRLYSDWHRNIEQTEADIEGLKSFIDEAHHRGILVWPVIASALFPDVLNPEFIEDVAARNPKGEKVLVSPPPGGWHLYYHGCLSNPNYREYLKTKIRAYVDAGVDGIEFDEATSHTWGYYENEGYCDHCMQEFREYLKQECSEEELRTLFDITNISTFNYRDYLNNRGLANESFLYIMENSPLGKDWWIFQLVTVHEYVKELADYARNYSLTTYNRPLLISPNAFELLPIDCRQSKIMDFMSIGIALAQEESLLIPPEYNWALLYKLSKAMAPSKPCGTLLDFGIEILTNKRNDALMGILISEAYASDGIFEMPYFLWNGYRGNVTNMALYSSFIKANPELFNGRTNYASVAVLYAYPSVMYQPPYPTHPTTVSFAAVCRALEEEHIMYDAVFAGDGNVMPDTFTLNEVEKYDILILPNCYALTDNQVLVLKRYAEERGLILVTGSFAERNEMDREVERDLSFNHTVLENVNPIEYMWTKNASFISGLIEEVRNRLHDKVIVSTNAPKTIGITTYNHSNFVTVHLVNYDLKFDEDVVTPAHNVTITISYPNTQDEVTFNVDEIINYAVVQISPAGPNEYRIIILSPENTAQRAYRPPATRAVGVVVLLVILLPVAVMAIYLQYKERKTNLNRTR